MKQLNLKYSLFLLFSIWALTNSSTAQQDHHDHEGHDHAHQEEIHDDHPEHSDDKDHDHSDHVEDDHAEHDYGAHEDDHDDQAEDDHAGHDDDAHEEEGIYLEAEILEEFGINIVAAEKGQLDRHLRLPGQVHLNQDKTAHIVPRYAGLALHVLKTKGDDVKKGDVLVEIEGNESLAKYELKALMDGTIIDRHITVGESVNEDDAVFVVSNLDHVWVDLAVFQKDLSYVKTGQTVDVTGGDHTFTGRGQIQYVSPTLDEHTRTGLARVVLPNEDRRWRPGMFVVGDVLIPSPETSVLVPRDAVLVVEGTHSVFVMNDEGGLEPRPVVLGRQQSGTVEILSGLQAGEKYAASHVLPLKAELNRSALEHAGHAH